MSAADVHYELEKQVPELQDLEERGIFSAQEIKSIVKKRTQFEYQVHRHIAKKIDFLRYIEYESNLEQLRRKRKKRLGLDKEPEPGKSGITISDYSLVSRIHSLYQKMLKKFKGDVGLWQQYFEWARKIKSSKTLARTFAKAIQLHPNKSLFWIMSASWEFEENGNIASARVLLQRGLRINEDSQELWIEYFRLELLWLHQLRERRKILFQKEQELQIHESPSQIDLPETQDQPSALERDQVIADSKNEGTQSMLQKDLNPMQKALLEVAIPRAVYRNAIRAIPKDLDFRLRFLDVYKDFDQVEKGLDEVYESIQSDFDQPEALKVLCERPLLGVDRETVAYPDALKEILDNYDQHAVQETRLFGFYADFLKQELLLVQEPHLRAYLNHALLNCFQKSLDAGACSISMFMDWIQKCTQEDKPKVVEKALASYPSSYLAWQEYIRLTGPSQRVYQEALESVDPQQKTMILQDYLDYAIEHLKQQETLELFEQHLNKSTILKYLQFLHSFDIDLMRKEADRLESKYKSKGYYSQQIELESRLTLSKTARYRMNQLWDKIHLMDPQDADQWLNHIQFEMEHDPEHAGQLYFKAKKHVQDQEAFDVKFQQMKLA
ncbi:U3 small nucleolar RNA-associated protein 6-domain-containing protein, partial [Gorgonomyces haynaldii]